ncbi:AraC family transcriptional regulator [Sphingomonas sp. TZW2008]|uniref:helix-turn-helix domain-containing protein n=1 Tax=Sphingomonas sp. TZW2008 TaxID=1917973 RepID=UPI000A268107|nr:hypothetical protein [Sphingomonas sp. TZW2008]
MTTGEDSATPDTAEFWRPAAALAPYISGYARYVIGGAPRRRIADVFFPAWTNLRFTLHAEGDWSVRLRRRRFDPIPPAALFGPSGHAGYVDAPRGTLVGIGVTPRGWARLFGGDASLLADRVVPLHDQIASAAELHAPLSAGAAPKPLFDDWLLTRLARAEPEQPAIADIFACLADPEVDTAAALSERTGLKPALLLRTTRRAFGFTPKLLLRRARFVRALMAAEQGERGNWHVAVRAAGYWDQSHFLRDCTLFLGQPLGCFHAMERPLNRASIAARARTLGQPMQSMTPPVTER